MQETRFLEDNIENIQQLMTIPPLRKSEAGNLGQLVRMSKIREYDQGEIIIQQGDRDSWLYFLLSGLVRVEKDGIEIAVVKEEGHIFGEMRVLDGYTRSASVYALEKTVLLAVDTAATERLPSGDDKTNFLLFLYRMFSEYLSSRLRLSNEDLIQSKKEIERLRKKLDGS